MTNKELADRYDALSEQIKELREMTIGDRDFFEIVIDKVEDKFEELINKVYEGIISKIDSYDTDDEDCDDEVNDKSSEVKQNIAKLENQLGYVRLDPQDYDYQSYDSEICDKLDIIGEKIEDFQSVLKETKNEVSCTKHENCGYYNALEEKVEYCIDGVECCLDAIMKLSEKIDKKDRRHVRNRRYRRR